MGFNGTKYSDDDFSGITSKLQGAVDQIEQGLTLRPSRTRAR